VLGLEEEDPREHVGLEPRRRGTLVHRAFQSFFAAWEGSGHGAISPALLPDARRLFADVVETALRDVSEADRLIERTRLLGSSGAPGLGERVFRLEAIRPKPVTERLLEYNLRGEYELGGDPPLRVALRGIADRIDLLADGSMRVIDYKTGRAPDRRRAAQLAIYAICAEQKLRGYLGRTWRIDEAAYLALGDSRPWVTVAGSSAPPAALEDARHRFIAALEGIARGSFPPSPADRRLCNACAYAAVCRKDYVGDAA
jgi:RecB family exonuclease